MRDGCCWQASYIFLCSMASCFWIAQRCRSKVGPALLGCRRASARRSRTFRRLKGGGRLESLAPSFLALLTLTGCSTKSDLPVLGTVPAFELTDQSGSDFDSTLALKGRVWVADFFFTNCPGPCPRMSSQMHQVQKALEGSDARLVSMTVDPA